MMKAKRLIAVILCLILACFTLAGCEEGDIGDFKYDDWEPEVIVKLEFDLYIIADSTTEAALEAQRTVQSKMNQYLDEKFNTTLNIKYIAEDDYAAAIEEIKINTEKRTVENAANRHFGGAIVLIVGKDMHDSLVADEALVDLTAFLAGRDHGKLKSQITRNLLTAATNDGKIYCVPNDHVVGEYQYTVINRAVAEGELNFSAQTELLEMLIVDGVANEKAAELITAAGANAENVIWTVEGDYDLKAKLESEEYICNVSKYPEVTAEEALKASFGIIKTGDIYVGDELLIDANTIHSRAMDIVYSINADKTVRNLLQYGVENTHYKLVENEGGYVYAEKLESSDYHMNLLYTGDMFNAYYCDEWTHEMAISGDKQNAESIIK